MKMKNNFLEISKVLSRMGYRDVLILKHESAKKILTEKRMEVIETLRKKEVRSIRELSRTLKRGVNVIYEDLQVLAGEGIVDFETQGKNKRPFLRHELIWIEPINLKEGISVLA
jgi:predicted transcriptional regulator